MAIVSWQFEIDVLSIDMNEERLEKRYQRERQAREAAESLLEKKSLELFQRNQELEEVKESLEKQILERTREAEKAKSEAWESNQAKSQFLANMSHATMTPLTAIIGFAEVLLQHKVSSEDSIKYLNTIVGSGRHLSTLLGEILDISKIENKNLELQPIRFNLPNLLQDIEQMYLFNCKKERLDFVMVIESDIPEWVVTDPTRLKQVLHNLLNNAIKFTSEGCISVHVNFQPTSNTLLIDVVDTGEGIVEEKQALIFEYFRQADATISSNLGGTGVGLFITKSLVELMGGFVELQSTVGRGSKFSVSIACEDCEGKCSTIKARRVVDSQSVGIPSLVGNILLVEDIEVNRQLITLNLRQTGAKIDTAVNGLEGLQMALSGEYDLILMDIQMPVMDGKEALKSLQQLGISTPIYALTANVISADIQEYIALGFSGVLSKPLELNKLHSVLKQYLRTENHSDAEKAQRSNLFAQDPKIKALFFSELSKQNMEITENIKKLDYAGLTNAAHIIKGSAETFGYDTLTKLASESLLLLRKKQYEQAVQQCTNLNLKLAEVLNEYND
ncbi:ATP-binding protein [Paraglaciecola arctica]|uniref:ATP-binding protein n=1 Tax=Paraglaciecola arctica TaxID=1128911 RepID=UPI001C071D2A|nr:ATP-binding protein [Paraglaciecola arctica]MBU3005054.1 response regulator [Paraglaciecola arctica]